MFDTKWDDLSDLQQGFLINLRELELHREFVDTVRKAIDNTPQDARLPIIQAALNKFDVKLEVLTEIVQATATEA